MHKSACMVHEYIENKISIVAKEVKDLMSQFIFIQGKTVDALF